MPLGCYHCAHVKDTDIEALVKHSINMHPKKTLSFLKPEEIDGKIKHRAIHYKSSNNSNILAEDIDSNNFVIDSEMQIVTSQETSSPAIK